MGSDHEDEELNALDKMVADPGLMSVPTMAIQDGPPLDTLYRGPATLDTSGGMEGIGCDLLSGAALVPTSGVGLEAPLGLISCGLPASSGAKKAPPMAHRREFAAMSQVRARDPVNEIVLDLGGCAAALPPSEICMANLRGEDADSPAPQGRGESDSSSSASESPPVKPPGAKKQRVKAPTRGSYTRGSLKTISEIQESGSLGQAMELYEGSKTAATSAGSHASRLKWWETMASKHGHPTYPLTVPTLKLAGSMWKGGGYRSAAFYIAAFKREHVRQG